MDLSTFICASTTFDLLCILVGCIGSDSHLGRMFSVQFDPTSNAFFI